MDRIPVELIGNILSKVGTARDDVTASATCRKWREAFCKHLHTLSFSTDVWPYSLSTSELEILITKTIFQTTGLQDLSVLIIYGARFSPSIVHAWLIYTRETLRVLRYNGRSYARSGRSYGYEDVYILEICGGDKLEVIELRHCRIVGLQPDFQRFSCLKSLMLCDVSACVLDLSRLLSACPTVELFELINPMIIDPMITTSDVEEKVVLSSTTLRSIFLEYVCVDKIILEADCLEILHVKDCHLKDFEVICTGTLKQMKLDDARVSHLCFGENIESLEVVDISNFSILWPAFLEMISKSSSLRKLQIWNTDVTDEDATEAEDESHDEEDEEDDLEVDEDEEEIENEGEEENIEDGDHSCVPQLTLPCVDLETVAACFPKLSHLSLSFDLKDEGSSYLTNVRVLELGWSVITDAFTEWVEGLLKRCPNLKRLVILGNISAIKGKDKCRTLANFNSSMVRLVRSYMQVEVQFEFRWKLTS